MLIKLIRKILMFNANKYNFIINDFNIVQGAT